MGRDVPAHGALHVHTLTPVNINVNTCTHIHRYTHAQGRMHTQTHTQTHIHPCAHTHTHTHMHSSHVKITVLYATVGNDWWCICDGGGWVAACVQDLKPLHAFWQKPKDCQVHHTPWSMKNCPKEYFYEGLIQHDLTYQARRCTLKF